ncbi:MAG: hypothetical protein LBS96_01760 [Oscillospiraceae bacterium]|jgi:hypothetical protein|nr:hypothetical protein [Oscillospiraceae bacterium]
MKSIKKLTALLLALLMAMGVFAISGSAAGAPFFAAKDEAGKYAVYTAALAELGSASDPDSLLSRYYTLQRAVNIPVVLDTAKEQYEADKAELASITPRVEALFATLTVNPGDTFVANSWFETSLTGPGYNNGAFVKDTIAWVNLRFTPGTLQNTFYNKTYNSPKKTVPVLNADGSEKVDANGDVVTEKVDDVDHPLFTKALFPAASAGTNVLDRTKTVFAKVGEDDPSYIQDGTTQVFSYYTLGRFGYLAGSPFQANIADNTTLTVPGIGGKALGFAPANYYHPVTGERLPYPLVYTGNTSTTIPNKNANGSYPLLPYTWTAPTPPLPIPPALPTPPSSYAFLSDIYLDTAGKLVNTQRSVTFYGLLTNTAVLDELITIDYACEYKGVNGTGQAIFDGWRIVGITNNAGVTNSPDIVAGQREGAYSALEPYNNYEITLEAQWKADPSNPFPVYSPAAPVRTWDWLKTRLERWATVLGGLNDEFGDPIPHAGDLLNGLLAWLLPFADWIREVTNVDLLAILEIFGLKLF